MEVIINFMKHKGENKIFSECYFIVILLNIHVNKNYFIPLQLLKLFLKTLLFVHFSLKSS